MGLQYRIKYKDMGLPTTTPEMRIFCQRPGKRDENGNIQYFTEQAHKDTCDVNKIIQKYDKTGLISHVSKIEAQFGDMTGADFKAMQDKVANATSMFNELPSEIRNRFKNNPYGLLKFMENPDNRAEAIKLGIINPDWTPETDGLGEHVKLNENVKKKPTDEETADLPN